MFSLKIIKQKILRGLCLLSQKPYFIFLFCLFFGLFGAGLLFWQLIFLPSQIKDDGLPFSAVKSNWLNNLAENRRINENIFEAAKKTNFLNIFSPYYSSQIKEETDSSTSSSPTD